MVDKHMVRKRKNKLRDVREFLMIALAMLIGSFGWCAFLLPHHITIGGIAGIASVIQWGFNIPVQYTYLIINGILLFVALKIFGLEVLRKDNLCRIDLCLLDISIA